MQITQLPNTDTQSYSTDLRQLLGQPVAGLQNMLWLRFQDLRPESIDHVYNFLLWRPQKNINSNNIKYIDMSSLIITTCICAWIDLASSE